MNGLELSHGFYETYGKPMLERDFADVLPFLAVGFTGSGSEHYGFDDEVSRDHDFEPGFCIFLPGEDLVDRRKAFLLERAYAKLPKEYCGVKRQPLSPVGGSRHGVLRTAEFYTKAIGSPDGILTTAQWLTLPDYALAEAVNGEIFFDAYGEVTAIRNSLLRMPEDCLLKRLAGNLLLMAQAGQYNFVRCLKHGEPEGAQLACVEFVKAVLKVSFLLHGQYAPYYKWSFRALRQLDGEERTAQLLSALLLCGACDAPALAEKQAAIEAISASVITQLRARELTQSPGNDLEMHAYAVNDKIKDGDIRNLHILAAIRE